MKLKLSLKKDQRRALVKGLVTALVLEEKVVTTRSRAKALIPHFEHMITQAKQGTLASRRRVAAYVKTDEAVRKLMDDLAKRFKDRSGGYVRIGARAWRRGDNAEIVTLELTEAPAKPVEALKEAKTSKTAKKPTGAAKQAVGGKA